MMNSITSDRVTLVEVLELTGSFEESVGVIDSAVRRLETEGIKELINLQFYANPEHTEIGVILTFSDRDKMMEHINMISGWAEFKQMLALVKPLDVKVYGKLSAEAEAWLRQINVVSKTFDDRIAGFGGWRLFATIGSIEQEWIVEDTISEGNKVVVRATNICRQESFFGVPAHGKQQIFTAIFIHQIVDEKIVETWRNADDLGRLLQLGARITPS